MKWVLALGMLCWGIRYALFSVGGPDGLSFALVIAGVALHGFCFDFFFAAGFIHVDNEAPRDIRASGQALFSFLSYGVGMWLGSLLAGKLMAVYAGDWYHFWLVPCIGVLASLTVFVLFFHIRDRKPDLETPEKWTQPDAATSPDVYSAEHQGRTQSGEAGIDV